MGESLLMPKYQLLKGCGIEVEILFARGTILFRKTLQAKDWSGKPGLG